MDLDACGGLLPIVKVIKQGLFPLFQIGIPIVLIIYGTIDLGKAVIASDEKEIKAAQSRLIKRFIYAAMVFLGGEGDTTSWKSCWRAAGN